MAYPDDPIVAYYKLYDGSNWLKYFFKTGAAQVGTDNVYQFVNAKTKVNGVAFTLNSDGETATVTINGTNITCSASAVSGYTLQYISSSDTIAVALGKLDRACKVALDTIPSGCLTTSNYHDTLDSVYQAKGSYQPLDADLTAIAGLTGTSGLLKKTAANTWSLDTTSYVPEGRTICGHALSQDISLAATDISYTNPAFPLATNVGLVLNALTNVVQGKQNSYAISDAATGTNVINTQFNSQNDVTINCTFTVNSSGVTTGKYLKLPNNSLLDIGTLKVGDNVYITESEVPDRWVSEITYPTGGGVGHITFTKLETQKVNLTWSSIQNKPTTLGGYGITDASINTTTKVITLGSNTVAPVVTVKVGTTSYNPTNGVVELPAYPDLSGHVPYSGATQNVALGQKSISGKYANFEEFDLEKGSATFSISASGDDIEMSSISGAIGVYADNFTFNSKNVATITAGTSQPSSPRVGDIWLDTTTPSA